MAQSGRLFRIMEREESGDRLNPRVYAYYFKQWNGFRMPEAHRHESTEVMFVMNGSCRVEVESESVALKKGEFIVIGFGVPHRLIVESTCRMLNVEFGFVPEGASSPSFHELVEGEIALDSLWETDSSYLVLRDPDELYHSLRSLVLELDGRGVQRSGLWRILLAQVLIRIARLKEETEGSGGQSEDRYIRRSYEYLLQNYDRNVQVKDVAAAVNLHPGYLQRIFRAVTGRTIIEALTAIRMEKARMLLKQTAIPVTDIYDYVGVGSRQYFHALFKKHTGRTPLEYRQAEGMQVWLYNKNESEDF